VTRRLVRVSESVFELLDAALGSERGPSGEPSAHDFEYLELPQIIERFASDFDELPEADGLSGIRVLLAQGTLVQAFAAFGLLLEDDSIDLISITVDRWPDESKG
jgi:hypothetical protein